MDKVIGWGIVGSGDVADRKAGASFNGIPGSRLVSVMRRDAGAAEAFARKHGAARWTTDAQQVIDDPEVTIVYVATPPAKHLDYALAVARAGKACLVEKPAGRSLAEYRRMRQAFRAAGLPLYVSYYRRHLPRNRKVKEILESGQLGEIVSFDYRMSKLARPSKWAHDVALSGGGHFYAIAGHMLDLFDDWFGPLEVVGSSVSNVIPREPSEQAVALSFKTAGGTVGSALWNFAAGGTADELIIDGTRGRLRVKGTSTDKPIRVDLEAKALIRLSQSKRERSFIKWGSKLGLPFGKTHRFERVERPHEALLRHVVSGLAGGDSGDNADEALRTAEVIDQALDPYYGGRNDDFWARPGTWQSLQAQASRRNQGPLPDAYRLTREQLQAFERDGLVGPFRCDGDWQKLVVPIKKGRNRHLDEADVFSVCTHPSVVRRVAQLMGRSKFTLFKSRFVVKSPHSTAQVAWHQDVGDRNGGFTADGKAVPTLAVWMGIDDIDPGNGGLEVIPGSHASLVGNYNKQIKSQLRETGALTAERLQDAVPVVLKPGEFIIYHGWLLHGSGPNTSDRRRAGLNMRFAPPGLECEEEFVYIPLEVPEVDYSDRLFMNETWHGEPNAA